MTSYTGKDNLEVMALAENYNAHLTGLLLQHVKNCTDILDFGAGTGTFARALRRHGYAVTCIETDPDLCSSLKELGFHVESAVTELGDRDFDLIYSLNVLEHIDDDRAAVDALRDRLRTGGRLFIYVPAFTMLFTSMDEKVGHRRRYTRQTLTALLTDCGLQVETVGYCDSIGFLATLAYKLIGSKTGEIDRSSLLFFDKYLFPIGQVLDRFVSSHFGKNVFGVATKA